MSNHRIARVEVLPVALPVKSDEDLDRGRSQQHVFLRLETNQGAVGWGEARALPSWTGETVESITTAIRTYFAPLLLGTNPFARNAVFATIEETVTGTMPAAKSAVDMALHDLQGKLADVPIHELYGGKTHDPVPLSHSVRTDTPECMAQAASERRDSRCLKVKITGNPGLDAERLAAVRQAAPATDIWLDANQNYSLSGALEFLGRLPTIERIVCLQQPVPSSNWLGMARLRERSPLPLAVDEGCFAASDVLRISELGVADLIVLKVCKSGGLREMFDTAVLGRHAGLDLLGSGLTESGVGLAAALHLFSILELRLPPQLNGPQFLEDLLVTGLEFQGQHAIKVPTGPGLGVKVDEEKVRALQIDL